MGASRPLPPQGLDDPSTQDHVSSAGPGRPPCGLPAPLALSLGPKQQEATSLYLGLAQEIHRLQVLQVPPMGPEDLTPGDLPRLQGDLFLEGTDRAALSTGSHRGLRADGPPPNPHGLWEAHPSRAQQAPTSRHLFISYGWSWGAGWM